MENGGVMSVSGCVGVNELVPSLQVPVQSAASLQLQPAALDHLQVMQEAQQMPTSQLPTSLPQAAALTMQPLSQAGQAPTPLSEQDRGAVKMVKVEVPGSSPELSLQGSSQTLLNQMSQLGPSDRCTPSQAQAMGQQLLSIIAVNEQGSMALPVELQNSFDIFHRCLAVVYGTFFLNLYTKANAPCLLCHGCKSLYPPGQFIHHTCPALPPNIVPCRSRMWRRCLVPLVSPGVDQVEQKQRWKYVIEKFSHSTASGVRRNPIPPSVEAQILEMPECKRGRFVEAPATQQNLNATGRVSSPNDSLPSTPPEQRMGEKALLEIDQLDCEEEDMNGTMDMTAASHASSSPPPPPPSQPSRPALKEGSALALAEQLVGEVRRLQQDLSKTRSRLQVAEELLRKLPSEAAMREQLAHALATQQALKVERDQAVDQSRLAQDTNRRLQAQLDRLHKAHADMERHFAIQD